MKVAALVSIVIASVFIGGQADRACVAEDRPFLDTYSFMQTVRGCGSRMFESVIDKCIKQPYAGKEGTPADNCLSCFAKSAACGFSKCKLECTIKGGVCDQPCRTCTEKHCGDPNRQCTGFIEKDESSPWHELRHPCDIPTPALALEEVQRV